jgi:hypothetical protein
MIERADFIEDEHLYFLDELRITGATNMFGAGSYVQEEYPNLTKKEARDVLVYWMGTFEERNSE